GDIILAFDGKNISTMRDLPRIVAEAEIGATVDVQLFRNGDTLTRKVEVARLEDEEVAPAEIPGPAGSSPQTTVVLGLSLADLNDDLRQRFGVPKETAGALITDVDPLSAAAEKGIRPGEIIVEVAQRPVSSAADVEKIVQSEEKAGRNSVLFRLSLAGEIRFVALRLGG
ncbi:MAG: PDZ domain-containing protein, partial [Parvibaculum sp.]|nr:PDZ domain-containing protein [Parvibaculum sp.]